MESAVAAADKSDSPNLSLPLQGFLAEAKRLRLAADDAEKALLEFLFQNENNTSLWEGTGWTFIEFVGYYNICKPLRYQRYRQIRIQHPKLVSEVSANAVLVAGTVEESDREDFLKTSKKFQETNGTPQSYESARRQAKEFTSRRFVKKTGMIGHAELAEENDRLHSIIRDRDEEIQALRIENTQLKVKLTAYKNDNVASV